MVKRVLRMRVKDKHGAFLRGQAREVNLVWNYSQDLSLKVLKREGRFMSAYDMAAYTKGASKEGLSLHSQTVQAVSEEYCTRRRQFKKAKLRWRVSDRNSSQYSLGWIPFKGSAVTIRNGQLHYQGKPISLWDSFGIRDLKIRCGSFSEDSRGRWYVNLTVDVEVRHASGTSAVGIDLGLKELATLSTGEKIQAERFYRDLEPALARAQRANKKGRVKAIHAKIANRRKDFLHKLSTWLVKQHGAIFVGDVDASALAQTRMAKSVLDAGWSMLCTQLQYKGDGAGCWVQVVSEKYSTQTCSHCGIRSGPKGLTGLKVRSWICHGCGTEHDRDTNAAQNILRQGLSEWMSTHSSAAEAKASEPAVNEDVRAPRASSGVGHDPLAAGIPGL